MRRPGLIAGFRARVSATLYRWAWNLSSGSSKNITRVFLSSTAKDMKDYRDKADDAIRRLHDFHTVKMEYFGAVSASPLDVCYQKLGECDVFVGIIGVRYGDSPNGQKSFTELECDAAGKMLMDRLIFIGAEDLWPETVPGESDEGREKQRRFRDRLQRGGEFTTAQFEDVGSLAVQVVASLSNWKDAKAGMRFEQQPGSGRIKVGARFASSGPSGRPRS